MPILALPAETSHLVTSTHLLVTPISAVKELVDNSLDAAASSIAVELSANTIDVIQVKDSGHGIPPTDRELFGRRGCTSKIRNEADLSTVGGSSLGFRGIAISALAGISCGNDKRVGVCEHVTATTKVEGETVARTWTVGCWNGGRGSEPTSHSVGTTMKLTGFFTSLPVRKQEALKNAGKTLAALKRMLYAYAMARPTVRFCLRILKGQNSKDTWTFAPCKPSIGIPGDLERLVKEAATKITNSDCVSQCTLYDVEKDIYSVVALLPLPSASPDKISGHRQFLQLDGRPMCNNRGLFKKLTDRWREAMKRAGIDGIRDGFMWLDMKCPAAAYDINVEPAKDDVLFVDERKVLDLVNCLLQAAYPEIKLAAHCDTQSVAASDPDTSTSMRLTRSRSRILAPAQTQILEEAAASVQPMNIQRISQIEPSRNVATSSSVRGNRSRMVSDLGDAIEDPLRDRTIPAWLNTTWQSNMYGGGFDEETEAENNSKPPESDDEFDDCESEAALNSVAINNPWVIAKMTGMNKAKPSSAILRQTMSPMRDISGNARHLATPSKSVLPAEPSRDDDCSAETIMTATRARPEESPKILHSKGNGGLPTPDTSSSPVRSTEPLINLDIREAMQRRIQNSPDRVTRLSNEEVDFLAPRQGQSSCQSSLQLDHAVSSIADTSFLSGTPLSAIPDARLRPARPQGKRQHPHSHHLISRIDSPAAWSPPKGNNLKRPSHGRGRGYQQLSRDHFIGIAEIGALRPSMISESVPARGMRGVVEQRDIEITPAIQSRITTGPVFAEQQMHHFTQELHAAAAGSSFTPINAPNRLIPRISRVGDHQTSPVANRQLSSFSDASTHAVSSSPAPPVAKAIPTNERPNLRRTTRTRTKSINPLPKPSLIQDTVVTLSVAPGVIHRTLRKLDAVRNDVAWSSPSQAAYTGNAFLRGKASESEIDRWVTIMDRLLREKGGDGAVSKARDMWEKVMERLEAKWTAEEAAQSDDECNSEMREDMLF